MWSADIIESINNEVRGLLYDVSKNNLIKLGYMKRVNPNFYRRTKVNIITINEEIVEAYNYKILNRYTYAALSKEYLGIIKTLQKI